MSNANSPSEVFFRSPYEGPFYYVVITYFVAGSVSLVFLIAGLSAIFIQGMTGGRVVLTVVAGVLSYKLLSYPLGWVFDFFGSAQVIKTSVVAKNVASPTHDVGFWQKTIGYKPYINYPKNAWYYLVTASGLRLWINQKMFHAAGSNQEIEVEYMPYSKQVCKLTLVSPANPVDFVPADQRTAVEGEYLAENKSKSALHLIEKAGMYILIFLVISLLLVVVF